MNFIIATHNLKKRDELQRILGPLGIDIALASEVGVELTDVEETGTTFEENAVLKAVSGCKESKMPCIADDSGLSVDFLNGAPGIYSARYAGEHGNDDKNIDKLLNVMETVPEMERTARFVSTVCCVFPDGKQITARGECVGRISFVRSGSGGFGYDPVFLPEDYGFERSMAELSAQEKDEISHRKRALLSLREKLKAEKLI